MPRLESLKHGLPSLARARLLLDRVINSRFYIQALLSYDPNIVETVGSLPHTDKEQLYKLDQWELKEELFYSVNKIFQTLLLFLNQFSNFFQGSTIILSTSLPVMGAIPLQIFHEAFQ